MSKTSLISLIALTSILSGLAGFWIGKGGFAELTRSMVVTPTIKEKLRPLDKYTIDALSQREFTPSKIEIETQIQIKNKSKTEFKSYVFSFQSDGKKVTGQINTPISLISPTRYPVILMLRGYVDQQEYETGKGTKNAAAFFAKNGFVTIAPDFLGYGGSDPVNPNPIEARFETYTTALTLLATIENTSQIKNTKIENSKLFIWSHSNGGQIAIALLEITGKSYPTTLWAPVTKPFPYSVLYFTDESEDKGKKLRREIANFEKDYDVELYSIDNYFDRISQDAPLQLHQGTADEAVHKRWSDQFVKTLKKMDKQITYHVYPGADHNLQPSWDTAVSRDLLFFKKHLK